MHSSARKEHIVWGGDRIFFFLFPHSQGSSGRVEGWGGGVEVGCQLPLKFFWAVNLDFSWISRFLKWMYFPEQGTLLVVWLLADVWLRCCSAAVVTITITIVVSSYYTSFRADAGLLVKPNHNHPDCHRPWLQLTPCTNARLWVK